MTDKQLIYDYLHAHQDGVIASINEQGLTESAVVGYSETPALELIFATNASSRKVNNILHKADISFVVWSSDGLTVQYEGKAFMLEDKPLQESLMIHFAKIPSVKIYANDPGQVYYKIFPTWIRFTDIKQTPWRVIEANF